MNLRRAGIAIGMAIFYTGVLVTGGLAIELVSPSDTITAIASTLWLGLVFAGVFVREAGWDFIDVRKPRKADAYVAAGAIVGYYAFFIGGILMLSHLTPTIESPGHSAFDNEMTTTYLVGLIVLAVVVTPPAEELIFRNGLQKVLDDATNAPIAIVVTSLVFAGFHYWSYAGGGAQLLGLGATLGFIFVNSVFIGTAYWWTDNLVVPVAIHGVINTIGISLAVMGF